MAKMEVEQKKIGVINGNPRAFANNFQSNCKINWNRYERDYKLNKTKKNIQEELKVPVNWTSQESNTKWDRLTKIYK